MAQRGRYSASQGRHARQRAATGLGKRGPAPKHARQPADARVASPVRDRGGYAGQGAPSQLRDARPVISPEDIPEVAGPSREGARPDPGASDYYSRDNYGSGAKGAHARPVPKRRGAGRKIAIAAVCVIAALALGAGAYALWFANALNLSLAPSEDDARELDGLLADVSLDEPFYMLLLGSDSREGSGTSSKAFESGDQERSDVMILARIDAAEKLVTLVSVPRDTPYALEDGTVIKINETYNMGGAAMTVKAVSEITGVEIAHYAEVHLSDLEEIVDLLGGVEVYVDRDLEVKDALTGEKIVLTEGEHTLDGQQAQAFVRARHAYDGSAEGQDGRRQGNVRTLLQAIVKKILSQPLSSIPGTILELSKSVTTDLRADDLLALAGAFAGGDLTMYSCTGPTDGEQVEEHSGLWLCYPNPEGWAELMRQVDAGVEPGQIDYAATQQAW